MCIMNVQLLNSYTEHALSLIIRLTLDVMRGGAIYRPNARDCKWTHHSDGADVCERLGRLICILFATMNFAYYYHKPIENIAYPFMLANFDFIIIGGHG